MDAQKTGKLINYLRTKKALTQKELAEKINVSDKAVSKWERGDGCPDVAILPNLAAVLETDVDSLLCGEIKRKVLSEEEMLKLRDEMNRQEQVKMDKQFLKNPDVRIKYYDFRRPDKFSKYELRKICNIFEVLCEKLRTELTGNRTDLLGINICSVDQLTNEEFIRTVPQRTFFYSYNYNKPGFAVQVDPLIGKLLLKQDCKKFPELTQIDAECLYIAYIKQFVQMMQKELYLNTEQSISYQDFELSLERNTLLPWTTGEKPNEMCMLVTLEIKTDSGSGMLNIQFNYCYIGEFCKKLGLFGKDGPRIQSLMDIKTKPVENNMFVEFGRFFSDSVDFEPGKILLTQKKFGEPLNVIVENEVRFGGEAVIVGENWGVRICRQKQDGFIRYDEEQYIALRLGSRHIEKEDLEKIQEGTILELDDICGDPIYIIKDGKCVARAEVVIVDDFYGVRILE